MATEHANGTPVHRRSPSRDERRTLPHNLDAEASILGGVILCNELLADLAELEIDDFYHHQHKVVWEAIRNLESKECPIDVVTLENEIERKGKIEAIGGIAFLGELALRVPTVDNVRAYRDDVRLLSRNRHAIIGLSSALEQAYKWPHEPSELISEVVGQLGRLEDLLKPPAKRLKLISIGQALEDLDQLAKAPIYPTPFTALNDAIGFGGFLGTQVYTVAAGTGRGKTTWVSHVAAFAAQSVPVVVASYEMKPGYFVARKAAGVLGEHSNDIIRGKVPMGRVLSAMPYPRMFLMHKPTLAELREAVQYVAQKFGTAPLVVVDYIQKLADEIALHQARPDLRVATSQASATLCDVADRTGAAVIAVSAIGRGKGKILSNPRKLPPYELVEVAKESGAVEYDGAGLIVLSLSDDYDGDDRIATITLAKVRFGAECHIDARYNGRSGAWRSLDRVGVDEKVATPPSRDDLNVKILAELAKGPAASVDALYGRVKGNKKTCTAAIKELIKSGTIVKNATLPGDGLVVAGSTFAPSPPSLQLAIEGA